MKKKVFKILNKIFTIALVLFVIYLVFRANYQEIINSLLSLTIPQVIFILFLGTTYLALDSLAYFTLIRDYFGLKEGYLHALNITSMGIFLNIATSNMGTIPLQSYYLHKQKVPVSKAIDTIFMDTIFHKLAVYSLAIIMFITHYNWLKTNMSDYINLIYLAFGISVLLIILLVLFCTWSKLGKFINHLLDIILKNPKYATQKFAIQTTITNLYKDSYALLSDYRKWIVVLLAQILKIALSSSIPYFALRFLGYDGLSFSESFTLTVLVLIFISVLPSMAGVGPAELAYLILFGVVIGDVFTSTSLIVYRTATYFWPFTLSVFIFMHIKHKFDIKLEERE